MSRAIVVVTALLASSVGADARASAFVTGSLGAEASAAPAAVQRADGLIDVLVRGADVHVRGRRAHARGRDAMPRELVVRNRLFSGGVVRRDVHDSRRRRRRAGWYDGGV